MLSLRATLRDRFDQPEVRGKGVSFGESWIDAFDSPHLRFSLKSEEGWTAAWVGERDDPCATSTSVGERSQAYRKVSDFEGIAMLVRHEGQAHSIELVRTAAGGCPIYVSLAGGVLTASWRYDECAFALVRREPNVAICRQFLTDGVGQTRETAIRGVFSLWPGESVILELDGLTFEPFDDDLVVVPGSFRSGARASDELMRIIEDVVRPQIERSRCAVVELSGGLDSSMVAIAASRVGPDLSSYGLIHRGAMGLQQQERRQELVDMCGFGDFTRSSGSPGPFEGLQGDDAGFTLNDDVFRSACVAGVDGHPRQPFDLILTGIGGDELTMNDTFFRRDWELKGPTSLSAMVGSAGRCDMFMRRGIWVSQPLAHPRVVNFCRALPSQMRPNRLLPLITLARAGLSDGFLFPRFFEHYGNLLQQDASEYDFERAFGETIVSDHGIGDYGGLLDQAYASGNTGFSYELVRSLWAYLKLDRFLKRYL